MATFYHIIICNTFPDYGFHQLYGKIKMGTRGVS